MSTPALIYILLVAFVIGVVLERESKSPASASVRVRAIVWAILPHALMAGLLYWGGFFAKVAP